MDALFRFVVRRARLVLACGLVVALGPALFLPRLAKDTRNDAFVPADHPSLVSRERVREVFGLADPMVLAVVRDAAGGVFTPRTLELVRWLTDRVREVPGIDRDRVRSLATESAIVGTETGLDVTPLMEAVPGTDAEAAALRRLALSQDVYLDRLVARDGRATLIVAELEDEHEAQAVYERLRALAARADVADAHIHVAGEGATDGYVGAYIDADAERLNPLAGLVVVLVLWAAYRTAAGVVVPLAVVCGTLSVTLGTMAAAGVPFYLVTSALTVILIGVSVCDAIHVLGEYYERLSGAGGASRDAHVLATMRVMCRPVVVTSATSVAGFLCMGLATYMPPLRAFGLFSALGVVTALALSLTVVPALLVVLPPTPSPAYRRRRVDRFGALIGRLGRVVLARPRVVLGLAALAALAGLGGAGRLRLDDERIRAFRAHEPIVRADRAINAHLAGTNNIDVLIEAAAPQALHRPENLRRIEALQRHLETLPHVRRTVSIVDYVKEMHRAMHGGAASHYVVPDDANLVAQYFLLYSMAGDLADLEAVMDFEGRLGNVRVTLDRGRWSDFDAVIRPAEAYVRRHFHGGELTATISGSGNALHQRAVELRRSHPLGVALAFAAVLAMTTVMFRSPVAGALCLVPVALAVLGTYAVMGVAGIWLGLGTSMAAAIAVGLAVDFAVHTVSRLVTLVRDDGLALETALARLYPTTGRALLFNFLAVCFGFGVLAASRVPAIGQFGLLVAVCVTAGFAGSLTVLVALVKLVRPAFLGERRAAVAMAAGLGT